MFLDKDIVLSIPFGWFDIFSDLCGQIDIYLGNERMGFHWTQLKEKFGAARWHWMAFARQERLTEMVNKAQSRTNVQCIVCGAAATLTQNPTYMLVLCPEHSQMYCMSGYLPRFYPEG